jgi:hypothetical protein
LGRFVALGQAGRPAYLLSSVTLALGLVAVGSLSLAVGYSCMCCILPFMGYCPLAAIDAVTFKNSIIPPISTGGSVFQFL